MQNQTVVSLLVDLVMDIQDAVHELANRDGVICATEQQLIDLTERALVKAQTVEHSHIIAKNVLNNGGIVPNAIRRQREFDRDMGNITRISDYRIHDADSIA